MSLKEIKNDLSLNMFVLHNQDNELIPNFSDYILLLQFIRHKTEEGKVEILLNSLLDYVKQIYLMISHFLFPAMT